jgi:hypothetical protein
MTPTKESAMTSETSKTNHAPLNKRRHPCGHIVRGIAKAAAVLFALGLTFWLLWNWAAVPLFTFPPLTYLQGLTAVMLMALSAGIGVWAVARRQRPIRSVASAHDHNDCSMCFGSIRKRGV